MSQSQRSESRASSGLQRCGTGLAGESTPRAPATADGRRDALVSGRRRREVTDNEEDYSPPRSSTYGSRQKSKRCKSKYNEDDEDYSSLERPVGTKRRSFRNMLGAKLGTYNGSTCLETFSEV
jgi:hypothetical protein